MTADWRAVFVPAWILIFSEFLTATILCHCAPMVHASTPRSVKGFLFRAVEHAFHVSFCFWACFLLASIAVL
jgi:hypothetical protein